jgi:FtsP/CotA-like multicopper oxidase with cupredoxin domain
VSTLNIQITGGDSAGPSDTGITSVVNSSNNFLRINQAVLHNAAVVPTTAPGTTPGDITLVASSITYTDVIAITLKCTVTAVNSLPANTLPQVYIKLLLAKGSSHDYVVPMTGGQMFQWTNPANQINSVNNTIQPNSTYDINGNAFTLQASASVILPPSLAANFTITCTPDKYADVQITGTIELAV